MKKPLPPPPLQLTGLSKRFGAGEGTVRAIEDLTLSVGAGERVAVTGPSGCGKSTLLSLAAGLERADSGEVRWDGQPIQELDEAALARLRGRRVGLIFQNYRLLAHLDALDNVALPLDLAGAVDARARARVWLDRVGLATRSGHRPAQLSGGEQQRVALARALVAEPAILLADEPTGSLDSAQARDLGRLLLGLAKLRGTALLLVTHDLGLAHQTDRSIKMKDGRLLGKAR